MNIRCDFYTFNFEEKGGHKDLHKDSSREVDSDFKSK
jgi:hypothetical protein